MAVKLSPQQLSNWLLSSYLFGSQPSLRISDDLLMLPGGLPIVGPEFGLFRLYHQERIIAEALSFVLTFPIL